MAWTDLQESIVEEFAGAQSRHVNAAAFEAAWLSARKLRRRHWLALNADKVRESNRRAARAYYVRLVADPVKLARRREAVRAAVARYYAKNTEKARAYNRARFAARKAAA